jgi:hypothetical protein
LSAAALRIGVLPKAPFSSNWALISKMAPFLVPNTFILTLWFVVQLWVLTMGGLTMGGLTMGVHLIGMLTILLVRELFSKCDPLNEECPHTNTLPYIEGSSI